MDDRGASWAGLVSRLSTFDVYLHYLAYEAFRRLYLGRSDLNLGINTVRESCEVYLRGGTTLAAMGLSVTAENFGSVAFPSITALVREGLLGETHSFGSKEWISEQKSVDAPDAGMVFTPSIPGIELFLWAHGHPTTAINGMVDADVILESHEDLGAVDDAQTIQAMREQRSDRVGREAEVGASDAV